MKKYCTSCGKQIVFSVTNKPKFCDSCGTKLNLGESLGSDNEEAEQEEESLGVDVEESTGGFSSNISKLEFDIQRFETPKETLGGLIDNPIQRSETQDLDGKKVEREPQSSSTNFIEEFKKEAGSIKGK